MINIIVGSAAVQECLRGSKIAKFGSTKTRQVIVGGKVGGSIGVDIGACYVSTIWKGGGCAPGIWVSSDCHTAYDVWLQQRCLTYKSAITLTLTVNV